MKRLLAIGDIHGRLGKLRELLGQVWPDAEDQVVFLGDYIDRGPDSRGVIDFLLAFAKRFPQTVFLRGNHEQLFLDALVERGIRAGKTLREISPLYRRYAGGGDTELFLGNGGSATLLSYEGNWELPPEHLLFLEKTVLTYRSGRYLFVHAGAGDGFEAEEQDPFVLLWSRFSPPGRGEEVQVVGHTITEDGRPRFEAGRIHLDTGAGTDGPLTACDLLTGRVWQAS